jgi:hypothetical protein
VKVEARFSEKIMLKQDEILIRLNLIGPLSPEQFGGNHEDDFG